MGVVKGGGGGGYDECGEEKNDQDADDVRISWNPVFRISCKFDNLTTWGCLDCCQLLPLQSQHFKRSLRLRGFDKRILRIMGLALSWI